MADYWFRPSERGGGRWPSCWHGWGAYPADWRGWVAILAFLAVEMGILWLMLLRPIMDGAVPGVGRFVLFIVISTALTVAFVEFCRRTTDGDWRWRWGEKDGDGQ